MASELVINVTAHETRISLIEKGTIAELYIERTREKGIVGNIYKGRVVRVLPGMQAAFVEAGRVLTPEQRAKMLERAKKRMERAQRHPGGRDR